MKRPLWNRWQRLEMRMIILAALAALLPLLGLGALSLYTVYVQHIKDAEVIQQEMARRAALRIDTSLEQVVDVLTASTQSSEWSLDTPETSQWILRRLLHQLPIVQDIRLVDAQGQERLGVSRTRLIIPSDLKDVSGNPAFALAREGRVSWGVVQISSSGEPLLTVFAPRRNPLTHRADMMLMAVMNLRGLWDEVTTFHTGNGELMYVVDASGRLLVHPDYSLVLAETHIDDSFLFQTVRQGEPLPAVYSDPWGQQVMGNAQEIPELHWWVVVEQTTEEALRPVRTLFNWLILGTIVAIIASAIPGWRIARGVTHPIVELAADAAAVGEGDLTRRSGIQRQDEIGQLAQAFNDMVTELQRYATELENRVAVRTSELQIALAQAQEADRLKSAFLATVSHELRTPLTSIKGFAETLLSEDVTWDEATQRDFLETIVEEADKLRDLVNQLLDMAQLEAGTLQLSRHACSLPHIVDVTTERMQPLLMSRSVQVHLTPDLPLINADHERVVSILRNLLENIVKYTPEDTPITITAHLVDKFVQITVSDKGPGIPPENMEHLFERFHRGDHPDISGTGLGLAICRGLVQAHGGRIWAESQLGQGTSIYFTLPTVAQ